MKTCFQCGGTQWVTSVSPSRIVRVVPCTRCSPGADLLLGIERETRRSGPARVAVTLLVWAASVMLAIWMLSYVMFFALFWGGSMQVIRSPRLTTPHSQPRYLNEVEIPWER